MRFKKPSSNIIYIATKNIFAAQGVVEMLNDSNVDLKKISIYQISPNDMRSDNYNFIHRRKFENGSNFLILADHFNYTEILCLHPKIRSRIIPFCIKVSDVLAYIEMLFLENKEPRYPYDMKDRELDVLCELLKGHSQYDIAAVNECSVKTVSAYKRKALNKIGAHSIAGAVDLLYRQPRAWI